MLVTVPTGESNLASNWPGSVILSRLDDSLNSSVALRSGDSLGGSSDLMIDLEDPLVISRDGVTGSPSVVDFSAVAPGGAGLPISGFILGIILDLVVANRAWDWLFCCCYCSFQLSQ